MISTFCSRTKTDSEYRLKFDQELHAASCAVVVQKFSEFPGLDGKLGQAGLSADPALIGVGFLRLACSRELMRFLPEVLLS